MLIRNRCGYVFLTFLLGDWSSRYLPWSLPCSRKLLGLAPAETARALHATGADVFLTVRDTEKGEAVVKGILEKSSSSTGKLELLHMDLGSLQSVKDCAADFLSRSKQLNVLINNAGQQRRQFASSCAYLVPLIESNQGWLNY